MAYGQPGSYNGRDVAMQDRGIRSAAGDAVNPAEYDGPAPPKDWKKNPVAPPPAAAGNAAGGSMSINDPLYGRQNLGIRNQIIAQAQVRHRQEEDSRTYNDWMARQRTSMVPAPAGGTVNSGVAPVPTSINNPVIPDFSGKPAPAPAPANDPSYGTRAPTVEHPVFTSPTGAQPASVPAPAGVDLDALGKRFGVERGRGSFNGKDTGPLPDAVYEQKIRQAARNSPEFQAELAKSGSPTARSIQDDARTATLSGKTLTDLQKDRAEAHRVAMLSPEERDDEQQRATIAQIADPKDRAKAYTAYAKEVAAKKTMAAKAEQTERFHQDMLSGSEKNRQAAHERFIKQGEFAERRIKDAEDKAKTTAERDALRAQRDELAQASKLVKDHMSEVPRPPKRLKTRSGRDQPDSEYKATPEYAEFTKKQAVWEAEHAKRTKRMQELIDAPHATGAPKPATTQPASASVIPASQYTHNTDGTITHANGKRYTVNGQGIVTGLA